MTIKKQDIDPFQKPEGMPDPHWELIEKGRTANRQTAIYLWLKMAEKKAEEALKNPLQLPLWPEPKRASPNAFLRSAVFPAIQGKTRQALKRKVLAAQGGYEIVFTGWQLDQSDYDVWLQAVHFARCHPLGTVCSFTGRSFLKSINRATGGAAHEWLKDVIHRLRGAVLEIKTPSTDWETYNLLSHARGNETEDQYTLQFDPVLLKLFNPDDWTALQWEERHQLKRKPLALWLHGYYSSHARPYPLKISTLCEMSGSSTRNFRIRLTKSFMVLKEVAGMSFEIDENDLVHCQKPISISQAKHLKKKNISR